MRNIRESIHVLHVDDQPDFVDMAAEFVERESDRVDVETATSANEAIDRLHADLFDCVVSDYDMPGQNGIEFLQAVREDYPDLPFILYTGKGSEEVASDAISAGVTDYLQKGTGTSQYEVLANRITNTVDKYWAQNELEVSQRRLNLFVEQSPLGVIRWDENFDVERMNDKATEILGYDESDLEGRSWEAIVPESDRDAVDAVVSNLLVDTGGYHSINENITKNGERIVCEWHNRVVTDDDGEVIAIYSQFQDVTERRERERRFEAIFNNSHTFTGLMDPDGTLLEGNETALTFGNVARAEVVGKPIWDTYWFEGYENSQETAKRAVKTARNGELFRDEIRVRGADEDAIIDFSVRPVFDESGDVTLLVPEGRDITDRKEREEELRETKAELEASINTTERQNQAFEAFLDIVNDPSLSFEDQLADVLELGVEFLDLDIGIVSNIDPPDYTVEHVVSHDDSIEKGAVLDFSDTFCTRVYGTDGPVAFHSPEEGDVKDHPSYRDLGLAAYLGEPLIVDGDRYGTLNFSSPNPREEPFSDGELAFIGTIAEWVRKELSRREREEEIHRLNQLHETVLANIRETVLLTDEGGQITYVCPNVHFIFGYDHEEVADMGSVESLLGETLIEPETLESDGEIRNIETTITDTDGRENTVLVTIRQVNIEDGKRLYSIRDITEHKERDAELRELKEEYETVFDTAQDAIFLFDVEQTNSEYEFRLSRLNPAHEALTGLSTEEDRGKTPVELFGETEGTEVAANYRRCVVANEPISYEETLEMPTGTVDWETNIAPVTKDGDVTQIVGVTRDVTDQRDRERTLEQLVQRTGQLIEATDKQMTAKVAVDIAREVLGAPLAGVHLLSDDGDRLEMTAAMDEVREELGVPPAYGRSDNKADSKAVWEAFEQGERIYIEDVAEYGTLAEETPAKSAVIEPLGGHGVLIISATEPRAFDETDRYLITLAAQTLKATLDRDERTQELERQRVRLDTFASAVSHDLRNPLSVASGRLALVAEECDSDNLEAVSQAHSRMRTLIEDTLTLARAGETIGETEMVDLPELVDTCWRNVETSSAKLLTETDSVIEADNTRLQQLLENLLRNAVEHGRADVTVTVGDLPDGFYVEDDGPGVPAGKVEQILQPGFSTTEDGTGFGLSIVWEIAKAHGWDLEITTGRDGGARFEFTGVL